MTKTHAERMREVFEEIFPQHVGVAQVIHHGMERVHDGPYGDGLITKFKKEDRPRIAVSIDMLDTGIDIPEVVNLVFMKPVQSRIKLWQMIGRGTRSQGVCRYFDRLPGGVKTEFLVIDFWQNDFGRTTTTPVPAEIPVLVRLLNTRLDIVAATLNDPGSDAHKQAVLDCRAMLGRVPTDSFLVRKVWLDIETAWEDAFLGSHHSRQADVPSVESRPRSTLRLQRRRRCGDIHAQGRAPEVADTPGHTIARSLDLDRRGRQLVTALRSARPWPECVDPASAVNRSRDR